MGAAAVVILANPVMVGFGQLVDGEAAAFIRLESEEAAFTRWATDNASSDALLMANAIPSLSGQQWVGSEDGWIVLDLGPTVFQRVESRRVLDLHRTDGGSF